MSGLSIEQKQLLFDYAVGLTTSQEAHQAESLLSSEKEAVEIFSRIKAALGPLESLEPESCPDDLAERTIMRLGELSSPGRLQLQHLLATEQARKVEPAVEQRLWPVFGRRLATAAVFMIVGGLLITTLNIVLSYARQNYWQQQCQMQLANIWRGINNYTADNDGRLPSVVSSAGAPWWKVGYQGRENQSNTRRMWLLVRGDYVNGDDFCCPATRSCKARRLEPARVKGLYDFPSRKDVSYSFRIMCQAAKGESEAGPRALIADLNPLFEKLPEDFTNSFNLKPNKKMLTSNSINHNRRGQNVLFCDGSARFVRTRRLGLSEDDIFTLQDVKIYKGCEVPSCESDSFLAP